MKIFHVTENSNTDLLKIQTYTINDTHKTSDSDAHGHKIKCSCISVDSANTLRKEKKRRDPIVPCHHISLAPGLSTVSGRRVSMSGPQAAEAGTGQPRGSSPCAKTDGMI